METVNVWEYSKLGVWVMVWNKCSSVSRLCDISKIRAYSFHLWTELYEHQREHGHSEKLKYLFTTLN